MSRDRYRAYPFEPGSLLSRTIRDRGRGRVGREWISRHGPRLALHLAVRILGIGVYGG
ncbi:hypothetical protein BO83DRAFT_111961 [Aspergillus eucalypticola CBS 122712]|uniref:Uncharacterized protein n=1 Tax=Aspergillus eucalypticola (strain CBS 122712 / IBT 29274) TaxID=1448314 RepID=A0A317UVW7_ASPEC|nr:uncharacterized protein BO83DRAFT_111961 [Aspergillus eucalypticola CBS 122712]PWY66223.1 hypothetical protein BO83DRAFT_111961 [Aspergillus eucalypticola CBS 122712]